MKSWSHSSWSPRTNILQILSSCFMQLWPLVSLVSGASSCSCLYLPCSTRNPTTPSRLMCSCCRSRKDAPLERLLRTSSIISARHPDTAANRASTAASWSLAARIFSLGYIQYGGSGKETERGVGRSDCFSSNWRRKSEEDGGGNKMWRQRGSNYDIQTWVWSSEVLLINAHDVSNTTEYKLNRYT